MNFFERQRQARRLSQRLVLLFALAVLGIVAVVDLAVVVGFQMQGLPLSQLLTAIVAVSVVTALVIAACSVVRTVMLRNGGGSRVAQQLGGVYVPEDTTDPALRRLRNVVEEMAIASGVPVPAIYVLDHEQSINAFAAGWSPADAAVAVTRGAMERLNRDELQGVIAHEFSHVTNGDMRLNIRLIGLLFGILALALVGRFLLAGGGRSSRRDSNGAPIALIGLAAMIAGFIGVFFGRLIKAAVSRQREYLADASAVQFTRQTAGLVGALKKIGGLPGGSRLASARTEDVSHMLFGDGMRLSSLYATHPPLPERIKALDPAFDPQELQVLAERWAQVPPDGLAEDERLGLAPVQPTRLAAAPPAAAAQTPAGEAPAPTAVPPGPSPPGQPAMPPGPVRIQPHQVVASVAAPQEASYRHAAGLLDSIPDPFLARARDPVAVVPLVFGLLLAAQPDARKRQYDVLVQRHGKPLADAAWTDANALASLPATLRLPLAELAFSALRRRSTGELDLVQETVSALIHADERTTVFEYCLSVLMHRLLHEVTHRKAPWAGRRRGLAGSRDAVAVLLATLAQVGHTDPARAEAAFASGVEQVMPGRAPRFAPPQAGVVGLDEVWPALDGLAEPDKERLVHGMVTVISQDGMMTLDEVELLRTVCAVLHWPLPPLAGSAAGDPDLGVG